MISDALHEVVAYSHALGFLELVKVDGTPKATTLTSIAADKTVVLNSQFVQPIPEFDGVFGLHDLGRLDTILGIPEYEKDATIKVTTQKVDGVDMPVSISFTNKDKDFSNDYRLMGKDLVETQLPSRNRKEIKWDVSFVPTQNSIQRLKFQALAAGSVDGTFQARTDEKHNLLFSIGDHSTHTGDFIFAAGVNGKIKTPREWPLAHVQGILNLTGDKTMDISDEGAMQITVTSGLAVHQYTILARSK